MKKNRSLSHNHVDSNTPDNWKANQENISPLACQIANFEGVYSTQLSEHQRGRAVLWPVGIVNTYCVPKLQGHLANMQYVKFVVVVVTREQEQI